MLSNGEFGERLVDHARRWRLPFEVLRAEWGRSYDENVMAGAFDSVRPQWVWMVACETSTGVRNALDLPLALCRAQGADLCVDAVSAAGLQAIDLSGVRFASVVSGKALGAYPGLAIVAHDGRLVPPGAIPRCLDLAAYRDAGSVPYTQSSNLLAALNAALATDWPLRWQSVQQADRRLRDGLQGHGFVIVADAAHAMPGVISIALPPEVQTADLARRMQRSGYLMAHRSEYLARRNWVQLCLMGAWDQHALELLPDVMATHARACRRHTLARQQPAPCV